MSALPAIDSTIASDMIGCVVGKSSPSLSWQVKKILSVTLLCHGWVSTQSACSETWALTMRILGVGVYLIIEFARLNVNFA